MQNDMTVLVHSKDDCPYCTDAKAYLKERGIPFTENLINDYEQRQKLYDSLGLTGAARSVPQIFIIDNLTGEQFPVGDSRALRSKSGL